MTGMQTSWIRRK